MSSCTPFPDRENTNTVFYITNVILVPVLFGVGFMGNTVTAIICNHASLRKENAVFIHLCGLAFVNAALLLCTVPQTLQEVEVFPANITYSRFMAYADMGSYIFGNISRHASLWLTVTLGFHKLYIANNPYKVSRLTRNSTNRMIVFVVVLVCILFNFPRFLEVSVREVQGHCFVGMSIWNFEITPFGSQAMFKDVYPIAITTSCAVLPLVLIIMAALLLCRKAGWKRLRSERVALHTAADAEERQFGLLKAVWVMLVMCICLELPKLSVTVYSHLLKQNIKELPILYTFQLITDYMSLVNSSVPFIILITYCSDFRRALRRTFCCLCNCADEFYEPCTCCNPSYRRQLKEARVSQKRALRKKRKAKASKSSTSQNGHRKNGDKHKTSSSTENSHFSNSDHKFRAILLEEGRLSRTSVPSNSVGYDSVEGQIEMNGFSDSCDNQSLSAVYSNISSRRVSCEPDHNGNPWV